MQFSRSSQVRNKSIRRLQFETTWHCQFIPASSGKVLQWGRQYGCKERLRRELGVPLPDISVGTSNESPYTVLMHPNAHGCSDRINH
jgi:hypothetical protein